MVPYGELATLGFFESLEIGDLGFETARVAVGIALGALGCYCCFAYR